MKGIKQGCKIGEVQQDRERYEILGGRGNEREVPVNF